MYDFIVFYTFLGLILFFIAVEIYRIKHYLKGNIVCIYPPQLGLENLLSTQMKIKLTDGREVDAEVFQCTICLGRFQVGDEVYLTRAKNKYQINLPFRFNKITKFQSGCCLK